jgi:hypothetical protein
MGVRICLGFPLVVHFIDASPACMLGLAAHENDYYPFQGAISKKQ